MQFIPLADTTLASVIALFVWFTWDRAFREAHGAPNEIRPLKPMVGNLSGGLNPRAHTLPP